MRRMITFLCLICFAIQIQAQENSNPSPIIFIYDASGSMWGQIEGRAKMEIATDVLSRSVNNLPHNQNVGLVAYGHRREGDCRDVEFLIDMQNNDKALINQTLTGIRPLGRTPLAYSATEVMTRLRESEERATVILVTDGIESCDGNICKVVQTAKNEGIDFKMHIIGFGLQSEETAQLQCAAKAGGGQYYDAENAEALSSVLNQATEATVDVPDGNFSVFAIKNGEPIDAMVEAYQAGSDIRIETGRTYRDSTYLFLPMGTYDLKVSPLEGSDVNPITVYGVESIENQVGHETVNFDAGIIRVFTTKNGEGWDSQVRIYQQNGNSAAAGRTYGEADNYELNPGSYDVEVAAIGLEGSQISHRFEEITVGGGEIIEITHNFKSGTANIEINGSYGLVDARINIADASTGAVVASGRSYSTPGSNPRSFTLTPGTYNLVLEAVEIEGLGKKQIIENLVVEENSVTNKEYLFENGIAMIGAVNSGELIDAMVRIVESTTNTPITASRTYTSESSNPRKFVLNPGTYEVRVSGLGDYTGQEETFSIVVEAGETIEKIITL